MTKKSASKSDLRPLQKLSLWFFHRPRKTALIWLIIAGLGVASYATLLKREGFPAIATPFAIGSGSYLVGDAERIDREVAKPVSDFMMKQEGVKSVQTQSFDNFYSVLASYEENVDAKSTSRQLASQISSNKLLPDLATFQLSPYEFGFTERGDDIVVSFFRPDGQGDTRELVSQAKQAAAFIKSRNLPLVQDVAVSDPFKQAQDPLTGQAVSSQQSFDRYGKRQSQETRFYNSVVIGILAKDGADNLELHDQVASAVRQLNAKPELRGYQADISASFAPQIRSQINELQTSLIEGLLAVLIIGSIIIAVRASFLTVISMLTVIAFVNALLYLTGYSLNTITLFALILSLALIVDDTIIMTEALDKQRRRLKDPDEAVRTATGKVSRAMIAATSTAMLSFAPLLFVGGILGSFIQAIPVTIIAALSISLIVALVFIPLFARYLLLGKKQMGKGNAREGANAIEARIAEFVAGPMLWAKGSIKKLLLVGLTAVFIGLGFIGAGGYIFQKVTFNIFPPDKDSDQLSVTMTYPPDTDIEQAQQVADKAAAVVKETVGQNFIKASFYGQADIQDSILFVDLVNYNDRDVAAPELIRQLNAKFDKFQGAEIEAASVGAGPPPAAFTIQIKSSQDRQAALDLAEDVAAYLREDARLKRPDGSIAKIDTVSVGNSSIYTRTDGEAFVTVSAKYFDTDTTTLFTLTERAVKDEFPGSKVAGYGLPKDAISFNAGQEEENMDSFKTLALAFPALLCAIYLLLALQFKSLLQPLLIFMAIPFSLFGIALGLYLTDNAFSFFTMLGFFALIGLSIKNTILLTDYANQSRRAGMGTIESAHEALAERFRPLIATSLTAVFSLIPLTLSSPFWEGLGVVLIFGLLSSTFLVITVFPYYYLGAEYLRQHINRRTGLSWLLLTIGLAAALGKAAFLAPFLAIVVIKLVKTGWRRRAA